MKALALSIVVFFFGLVQLYAGCEDLNNTPCTGCASLRHLKCVQGQTFKSCDTITKTCNPDGTGNACRQDSTGLACGSKNGPVGDDDDKRPIPPPDWYPGAGGAY